MSRLSRRAFLGVSIGAGLTGAAAVASSSVNIDTYALLVREVDIPVPNLPTSFHGYRIAFVSDCHVGTCAKLDFLREVATRVGALKPDLVLHGGDFLWRLSSTFSKGALSLSRVNSCFSSTEETFPHWLRMYLDAFADVNPPDGSFGVLGNHEGGVGASKCVGILSAGGIPILQNAHVTIGRSHDTLRIIGYEDYWTGIPRTPRDLPSRDGKSEVRIVLAHNPDTFSELLEREHLDFDVGLAGHTHGGQVRLPGVGALFYNVYDQRFSDGLWVGTDGLGRHRAIFTTRGIGTVVVPYRVNCPPEIALLSLVPSVQT